MDNIFCDLPFIVIYIDLLITSPEEQTRHHHLQIMFQHLDEKGMLITLSKCQFAVSQLDCLGHHILADGIRQLTEKVQTN